MSWPRAVQLAAVIAVVSLTIFVCSRRNELGPKGTPVSLDSIALCIAASAVAAFVITRVWHWLPAPFIAGVVGVFFGERLGPVGGVIGVLVGVAVVAVVIAQSRLSRRCS
jgi:hypothetical protein